MDSEHSQYTAAAADCIAEVRHRSTLRPPRNRAPAAPAPTGELSGCPLSLEEVRGVVAGVLDPAGITWELVDLVPTDFVAGTSYVRLDVGGLGTAKLGFSDAEELTEHLHQMSGRLGDTLLRCPSCGAAVDILYALDEIGEAWSCECGTAFFSSRYGRSGSSPVAVGCWGAVASRLMGCPSGAGTPGSATVLTCVVGGQVPVEALYVGVTYRPVGPYGAGALVPVFAVARDARMRDFVELAPGVQASLAAAALGLDGYADDDEYSDVELTEGFTSWAASVGPLNDDEGEPSSGHLFLQVDLPLERGGRPVLVLSSSPDGPLEDCRDRLHGAGYSWRTSEIDDVLDAARVSCAASLAAEFGPGKEWEIGDDSPLSVDLGVAPEVRLSLRTTEPLAPFASIEEAKDWIEDALDLAAGAFERLEVALAEFVKRAIEAKRSERSEVSSTSE